MLIDLQVLFISQIVEMFFFLSFITLINCGFGHIWEQAGHPQFVFEAKSVQRMELLVLNRLEWRLRAITPCSYIRYFLRKMSKCDQEPPNTLISRSLQVIASKTKGEKSYLLFVFVLLLFFMILGECFGLIMVWLCEWAGIDFLEFRPSEVAAAVALSVSGELYTVHFDNSSFSPLFSLLQKVKKETPPKI